MDRRGRAAQRKVKVDHHDFKQSSRVEAGWWNPETKVVTVLFPDGTRWAYEGVDRRTWTKFVQSGSAGRYLADVLDKRPNHPA